MHKTNAVRLLDQLGIRYELREYEVDENDLAAESVAAKIGLPNPSLPGRLSDRDGGHRGCAGAPETGLTFLRSLCAGRIANFCTLTNPLAANKIAATPLRPQEHELNSPSANRRSSNVPDFWLSPDGSHLPARFRCCRSTQRTRFQCAKNSSRFHSLHHL